MKRVKCPRERSAYKGACQRPGCNHLASEGSVVCGCCLQQLGSIQAGRISFLKRNRVSTQGGREAFAKMEADALDQLKDLPMRKPLGAGWQGESNRRSRG